jgi:hypothetical protein
MEPNVYEDSLFLLDNKPIGFYIKRIPEDMKKYMKIAKHEFRSKRVPKARMNRGTKKMALAKGEEWVEQLSTVLGAIPPKPHFRRPYISMSSTHAVESAQNFIKAMYLTAVSSEDLIRAIIPEQYKIQKEAIEANIDKRYRFTNLFTSSISNYNISAPYHTDKANLVNTGNIIINERVDANGGNLHIPDYGCVIDACNDSLTYYPAYKSMHGVTPIHTTSNVGRRNSFVFYAVKLKANK